MNRALLALALVGAAGALLLLASRNASAYAADADASLWDIDFDPAPIAADPFASVTDAIGQDMTASQQSANVAAFLVMIRYAEGTAGPDGYRTLFGGALFDSYADHPRQAKQFTDKAGRTLWTSAAGAFQAMAISPIPGGKSTKVDTWDRIQRKLSLPDFSPASQDAMAIELIREAGALPDVEAGAFESATRKVRRIWASLPGAGYNQSERSLSAIRTAYLNAGGAIA